MRTRTTFAAASAVAVLGTGAILLPAVASPHTTTHTLKFTAVTMNSANFSKTSFGQAEKDVNHAGKIIGFDVVYGHFNVKTNSAAGAVTLDTNGGLLYGSLKFSNNGGAHGRVTGGTGKFKGVTGTIVGKQTNKKGTRTAVTVTYHH